MEAFDINQKLHKQDEIMNEFGLWRQFIKSECVSCDRDLKPDVKRYLQQGNFCDKCNAMLGRRAEGRLELTREITTEI